MPLIESDDFSTLAWWYTDGGTLYEEQLEHHIEPGAEDYKSIYSRFLGAQFLGLNAWSISIEYNITDINLLMLGAEPQIMRVVLKTAQSDHYHGIVIEGGDTGDPTDKHSKCVSTAPEINPINNYYPPLSGTITISHDGNGGITFNGAGQNETYSDIISAGETYYITLEVKKSNTTYSEYRVLFDNLNTTGGSEVPSDEQPREAIIGCSLGLKSIFGGLSSTGAQVNCGLSIAAFMSGGRENVSANLLALLEVGANIKGERPHNATCKAGVCLTCLMRSEQVPDNVLQAGFGIGAAMNAGQTGESSVSGGLFLGCKMGGVSGSGLYPCLSQEFKHQKWF